MDDGTEALSPQAAREDSVDIVWSISSYDMQNYQRSFLSISRSQHSQSKLVFSNSPYSSVLNSLNMGSVAIPKTQKAAQYHRADNAIHINIIPVPELLDTDILVKTICSSLCRSDLMNFEVNDIGLKLESDNPVTLGHEAAGVIVAVGSKTKGFRIGQEVGFLPATNCCYECEGCQVHQMWCEKGCKMPGHAADGFFQEYIAVDWRNAIVLPKGLTALEAAPLFCAGVTSYHGVDDCGLKPGQWMAIIGVGGLGHLGGLKIECGARRSPLIYCRRSICESNGNPRDCTRYQRHPVE